MTPHGPYALQAAFDLFATGNEDLSSFFAQIWSALAPSTIELVIQYFPDNQCYRLTYGAPTKHLEIERTAARVQVPPTGSLHLDLATAGLFSGRLTLERKGTRRFSGRDRETFAAVAPFLARCLEQLVRGARVADENRILLAACDSSETSLFLFDDEQQITFVNNRADELLCRQTEGVLAVSLTVDRAVKLLQYLLEALPAFGSATGAKKTDTTGAVQAHQHLLLTDGTRFDMSVVPLVVPCTDGTKTHLLVMLRGMRRFEIEQARPALRRASLSEREIEVVALLLQGHKSAEIARRLSISIFTVKDHFKHIYQKLGIRSRADLVSHVLQLAG